MAARQKKGSEITEPEAVVSEETPAPVDGPPAPPPEEPLDAVIIVKRINDQGGIFPEILLNGKVQPTEVQTLLELGVKTWREQIGLSS